MLKAVIFDMDGVVIDSEMIHAKVESELFKKLGFSISDEEHDSFVGSTTRSMWEKLKEKFALEPSVDELVNTNKENYLDALLSCRDMQPIPGVVELIKDLASNNVKLSLASSSSLKEIDIILGMFDIKESFHAITSGDEVDRSKPAPDIFLLAAERLGVSPKNCVVIEDASNGVAGAKAAGMKAVGYKAPNSRNQDLSGADIVVTNLLEVSYHTLKNLF